MENVASVRFVIAVNNLKFRFNADRYIISIKVVLNLKIFIITFVISLDYLCRIVILGR